MRRRPHRLLAMGLVVGLLGGAAVVESRRPVATGGDVLEVRPATQVPTAAPAGVLSSAWHCAGGSVDGGQADLTVLVANVGDEDRAGTVTWVPVSGEPVVVRTGVDAGSVSRLAASDVLDGDWVAATVEMNGGEVVVEREVRSARGFEVSPCSSQLAGEWHLAYGTTSVDATELLALYNPRPDDAIVDIRFATDEGVAEPPALAGFVIAGRTLQMIDIGQHVRRREVVAATVAARTGQLVVDRIQYFDGSAGRRGLSASSAAPATSEIWQFPEGLWEEDVVERYYVYNPSSREAVVDVSVLTEETATPPQPVERTVGPGAAIVVDLPTEAGLEAGVGHSVTVESVNEVGVVVERELLWRGTGSRRGFSVTLGAPAPAERWAFAAGEVSDTVSEWVVIRNPSAEAVTVSIVEVTGAGPEPIADLDDLEIDPSGRLAVRLADYVERDELALVVEASAGVVVERNLYQTERVGLSTNMGVVLR